ncbi:hypothetical protein K435DRAFT_772014 [Dendrothele bispora CBS 962.96]|uniref:MARVEL domain-containing protein n=1 Tax=Dendrothele bispora (strain CBS 962.96) TaxID=1314807 RepID=A0A4S8MZF4_DENBC|nr:hypothetical protein K435DRAFT_772014 [Dendrothele bispora CBS 962.96]
MTVRFANYRIAYYVAVFLLSGTVLGLAGHFANLFLPGSLHHDYTIFALIVPSLTIFVFLLTLQWAQPRIEMGAYVILGILWLAMGAWSTDVIGPAQCDGLRGQRTPTKNGDMNAQEFCYEIKVMQAFSWMLFCLFVIWTGLLLALVSQAQRFGRWNIWSEPIQELGWFGEWPGYYNTHQPGMVQMPGYVPYGYPLQAGSGITQQPGHSIIIQPSANGGQPTITQVPLGAV